MSTDDLAKQGWREDAACRRKGVDVKVFFPPDGLRGLPLLAYYDRAKRVCDGCPVIVACLDWALTRPEKHGVFGGMTPAERKALARERKRRDELATV